MNFQTNLGLPSKYITTRFRAVQSLFWGADISGEHSLLAKRISGLSRANQCNLAAAARYSLASLGPNSVSSQDDGCALGSSAMLIATIISTFLGTLKARDNLPLSNCVDPAES